MCDVPAVTHMDRFLHSPAEVHVSRISYAKPFWLITSKREAAPAALPLSHVGISEAGKLLLAGRLTIDYQRPSSVSFTGPPSSALTVCPAALAPLSPSDVRSSAGHRHDLSRHVRHCLPGRDVIPILHEGA